MTAGMGTLSQAADGHDCVLRLFGLHGATCATTDLMFRHRIGVTTKTTYDLKALDSDLGTEAFASRADEFAVREGFANPGAPA